MAASNERLNVTTSDQYSNLRKTVEAKLAPPVPMAYSTTGAEFGYEAPLSLTLPIGCYIRISTLALSCLLVAGM